MVRPYTILILYNENIHGSCHVFMYQLRVMDDRKFPSINLPLSFLYHKTKIDQKKGVIILSLPEVDIDFFSRFKGRLLITLSLWLEGK